MLTYTYDSAGNIQTIRSSNQDGSPRANATSVDYVWDAANQLLEVTDNRAGGTTTATYTPTGEPSLVAQPNSVGLTYSYDSLDRVASMLWRRGTAQEFGSWAYTHNGLGQRLTATDVTGRNAAYGYDAAQRLASETITGDPRGVGFNGAVSYALDGSGNRLSRTSSVASIASATYSYDQNDQLASDGYDSNGNTVSANGHTFAYDFENRLVSKDSGAVTLLYNCDGDRVAKTVGGSTTQYLVDDMNPTGYAQVLEEVVGGAVQTRYTYGTSLISQVRNVPTAPTVSYYGYDAHGNITFLTDQNGDVTASYDYDAWGNIVASTGSTPNSRLFAGEEFDADLGLINLRARQYDPGRGRFLSLDLVMGDLARPISLNRYLYTEADPANRTDPLGLMSVAAGALVGWAAPSGAAAATATGALASARVATEYLLLAIAVTGTLVIPVDVSLGLPGGQHNTIRVSGVAFAAGYAIACLVHAAISTVDPGYSPGPPFQFCAVRRPPRTPANDNSRSEPQVQDRTGDPTKEPDNDNDCKSGGGGSPSGPGGGGGPGGGRSWLSACYDMCSADTFDSRYAILMNPADDFNFLNRLKSCGKGRLVSIFEKALNLSVIACRGLCYEYFGSQ
jgi:RHS repeat-associated protein